MAEPFIGEIRMFAGNFAPRGWAFCNGQLLPISQHSALFSILGTTYGGDGQTTFALPDLRGRAPMHWGDGPGLTLRRLGESGGSEKVTLTTSEMPAHNHQLSASSAHGDTPAPEGALNATAVDIAQQPLNVYHGGTPNATMAPQAIRSAGGGQPHNNMQPFLCVSFIIALEGLYPSRS